MKNRRLNKFLGPAVILIWIMVIWRFAGSGDGKPAQVVFGDTIYDSNTETMWIDSFALLTVYRDPFLGQMPQVPLPPTPPVTQVSSRIGTLVKKTPKKKIYIPSMVYQGGVSRQDSTPMTGILKIDRKTYTIRQGDSLAGVKILDIQMDELWVAVADTSIKIVR